MLAVQMYSRIQMNVCKHAPLNHLNHMQTESPEETTRTTPLLCEAMQLVAPPPSQISHRATWLWPAAPRLLWLQQPAPWHLVPTDTHGRVPCLGADLPARHCSTWWRVDTHHNTASDLDSAHTLPRGYCSVTSSLLKRLALHPCSML